MPNQKPMIAYISQYLPRLTETFVYREIGALRALGYTILTLSIKTPDVSNLSAESLELFNSTRFFAPLKIWPVILAQLYFLFSRPKTYLRTLWFVMTQPGESIGNRKRTFGHFIGGAYHAKYLEENGATHIHAHFSGNSATYALVISRLLGITFSFTAHNSLFTDQLILRPKLEEARFIIAISEFTRRYVEGLVPNRPDIHRKIEIVHCGIELENFPSRQASSEQTEGDKCVRDTLPLIFSVSRMDERKGFPYLVAACKILRDRGVSFRCVIGGDGAEMGRLQSQVAQFQLDECVSLPGFIMQEDLQKWLEQAAMLVLPCIETADGDVDGVPVTLMEAMAKEVPVISTTVSGIPELITDQVDGLLVSPKNGEALADAIQHLLENRSMAVTLGQNGRKKVAAEFDVDKNARRLGQIFDERLGKI